MGSHTHHDRPSLIQPLTQLVFLRERGGIEGNRAVEADVWWKGYGEVKFGQAEGKGVEGPGDRETSEWKFPGKSVRVTVVHELFDVWVAEGTPGKNEIYHHVLDDV